MSDEKIVINAYPKCPKEGCDGQLLPYSTVWDGGHGIFGGYCTNKPIGFWECSKCKERP